MFQTKENTAVWFDWWIDIVCWTLLAFYLDGLLIKITRNNNVFWDIIKQVSETVKRNYAVHLVQVYAEFYGTFLRLKRYLYKYLVRIGTSTYLDVESSPN